jgi:hypothetical protein
VGVLVCEGVGMRRVTQWQQQTTAFPCLFLSPRLLSV